jgi:hypothetical protein
MAQDFVRYSAEATDSAVTVFTANSNDAVIGVRVTNTTAAAIAIDVWVSVSGSTDRYIAKRFKYTTSKFRGACNRRR